MNKIELRQIKLWKWIDWECALDGNDDLIIIIVNPLYAIGTQFTDFGIQYPK